MYKKGMNVKEAAEAKGLDSWDSALPQIWVDEVRKLLPEGMRPMGNIVWCYRWDAAGFSDNWGRPVAVTYEGELLLGWLAAAFKA